MKKKVYYRVYKDDDFAEKGWAYEVSRDPDYKDIFENGHTYDHDRAGSIAYAKDMAKLYKDAVYLVDENGEPYVADESFPAGGGLDCRCDFNAEALHAFNDVGDRYEIREYLDGLGFEEIDTPSNDLEIYEKGNTRIVLESYIDGMWGYIHTEYIK